MYRRDNFAVKQTSSKMGLGKYKYIPLILSLISVLSLLACISTDYWYIVELSASQESNEGLWRRCIAEKCKRFSGDIESWFQAARAFLLLGVLCLLVGIVFFFIALRFHKVKVVYPSGFLISCLIVFFSLILYGIKQKTVAEKKLEVTFGYSYICGWISGTLSIIAAVLGYYDIRKRPVESATTTTIEITVSNDSLDAELDE